MERVALLPQRDVDLAQRLRHQPDARVGGVGRVACSVDAVDQALRPIVATSVERAGCNDDRARMSSRNRLGRRGDSGISHRIGAVRRGAVLGPCDPPLGPRNRLSKGPQCRLGDAGKHHSFRSRRQGNTDVRLDGNEAQDRARMIRNRHGLGATGIDDLDRRIKL